jgi:hypothetical protein
MAQLARPVNPSRNGALSMAAPLTPQFRSITVNHRWSLRRRMEAVSPPCPQFARIWGRLRAKHRSGRLIHPPFGLARLGKINHDRG